MSAGYYRGYETNEDLNHCMSFTAQCAFLLWVALPLFFTSCAYGPKTKASGLEVLNGSNYEGSRVSAPLAIPIVKRRESNSVITGTVLLEQNGIPTPVFHEKLQLIQDGKILLDTVTAAGGRFQFSAPLVNGRFELKIDSDRYLGSRDFYLDGYKMENLQVFIRAK